MLRETLGSDPRLTSARVAVNGLPEVQAILVVVVSLIALRLTLNWSAAAMRRARIDTGTQILVKRGAGDRRGSS